MAASVPVLIITVWSLQHVYLRTSRQLRLLDIEAKSPLYSHFLESLSGLITIRAFGWEAQFQNKNAALLDNSQRPYYLLYCVQRWLTLVLDLIVGAEAVLVVGLAVGLRHSTTPGLLGVSLNNILCKLLFLDPIYTANTRISIQRISLLPPLRLDNARDIARVHRQAEKFRKSSPARRQTRGEAHPPAKLARNWNHRVSERHSIPQVSTPNTCQSPRLTYITVPAPSESTTSHYISKPAKK